MSIARSLSLFCFQRLFRLQPLSSSLSFPFSTAAKGKAKERALLHPSSSSSFLSLCPNRNHETLPPASHFSSSSQSQSNTSNTNSSAAFDYSSEEEEDVPSSSASKTKKKEAAAALPPPYDPFSKKNKENLEPEDPKNLQEIFHKMRTEGLVPSAVKMFDALSKDGLTHEALELFSLIKDKGSMPDVVAHTAVVEAYANAGHPKEALRVFMRMLASGVRPNAYTYFVLIRGLAADARTLPDAKRHLLRMIDEGILPNAATYMAVFEAFFRVGEVEQEQEEKKQKRLNEARKLLDQMRAKGFAPDEKAVRDHLGNKRGQVFRTLMNLLFDK